MLHNVLLLVILLCLLVFQEISVTTTTAFAFAGRIQRHYHTCLALSENSNKNLSAAAEERRQEEKRRLERQDDVVIGKTSALFNAQDYAMDPAATQELFLQQASRMERLVNEETERGLEALRMLSLNQANEAFDKVFELKPEAYLWQAGIVKYYLDQTEDARDILDRAARFFEGRFQQVASEERIWRDACRLKLGQCTDENDNEDNADLMPETRKVHKIALQLFSSSLQQDLGTMIVCRAKLHDISHSTTSSSRTLDLKLWKLSSWFFLALHHDALGQEEESKACCKAALLACSNKGQDVIHTLPALHMASRDWFDDDEIFLEQQPSESVAADSIRTSLQQLKLYQLKDMLKRRGLTHCGSKQELQDKLFHVLLEDI